MTSREKTYWQITEISCFFDFDSQIFGFLDNLANWWYVRYVRKENPRTYGLYVLKYNW